VFIPCFFSLAWHVAAEKEEQPTFCIHCWLSYLSFAVLYNPLPPNALPPLYIQFLRHSEVAGSLMHQHETSVHDDPLDWNQAFHDSEAFWGSTLSIGANPFWVCEQQPSNQPITQTTKAR
jgi:hypothetical protein